MLNNMQNIVQIQQLGFQDLGIIQPLFRQVFGTDIPEPMLAWKYGQGRGRSCGAFAPDGTLLAHCGIFYRDVLAERNRHRIAQLGDLMALPGRYGGLSRSKSPFALLIQRVLDDLPGEANPDGLAFGFPSDRAMRLGEHLGLFASIDRIRQLTFAPLSRPSLAVRCETVQPDDSALPATVERLWRRMAAALGNDLVGIRDGAYLMQRYAAHPLHRYDFRLVLSRWLRRPFGVLITRTTGHECELMDIIAHPSDLPDLLETARQQMEAWGVTSLKLWLTERHSRLVQELADTTESTEFRIMANPFSSGGKPERFADRWWLTSGDTDYR
jgi:hypothetical protein